MAVSAQQRATPAIAAASSPVVAASAPLPIAAQAPQSIAITIQMPPAADVHWTAYATAVVTPAVALLAVVAATYVGVRNWQTARDKLRLELFEKRWAFYEAINNAITEMIFRRFGEDQDKIYRQN